MSSHIKNNAPVAITGMGAVSRAGLGPVPLWESVFSETPIVEGGLSRITESQHDQVSADLTRAFSNAEIYSSFDAIALHAIHQAMKQAGWDELRPDDGLLIGTTTGNILAWEGEVISEGTLARYEPLGAALQPLQRALKFKGPARLITTACSSSTQAIALGALWLRTGRVKRCIVGGAEVLSRLTIEGFRCLQLLSANPATPFDEKRAGINLSEASAFLCLEAGKTSRALAYVSGFGMSSDCHHMTAPHPEGRGCLEAMQAALTSARLPPSEVGWIYAHGTGSAANDLSEGAAIQRLFGTVNPPWVSSTKGHHGHALAASGALEVVIAVSALEAGVVLRTLGLVSPDPKILVRHPFKTSSTRVDHIIKNSLGFGGGNASVVISRREMAG